ncbi:MAG: hypothetical protein PSV17_04200 [Methylotenera sp.]|uniref:hypothetical protein n=1 Tax=Methylotenera sp. TaxID=2051956 RepID=UPI002489468E|nr:hypothetical protein [Methylotenera sp.]MDI1308621.1 hypothetical protein [Methylotenera sp.]
MITSHHFKETYQQYQQDLIPFRLLQEQAIVMLGLCSNTSCSPVDSPLTINNDHLHWLLLQPEAAYDYSEYLGGYMYVCESEDDLKQIVGCDFEWAETHDGAWPNVTDLPMVWDSCCYLPEATSEPLWAMFLMCWNNAGGSVYYVPKHLWKAARVTEHIELTNNA